MSYSTYFFEIRITDYVELFRHLNTQFGEQGLMINALDEYTPSERDPFRRLIELSELDEELRKLEGIKHAPLHAWYFPFYEESYCRGIPASALSVDFRLMKASGDVRKCVLSAPGEVYEAPEWSVPYILVDTDISLIIDSLGAKWPTKIVKGKNPRLGPEDCISISQSLIKKELGICPAVVSIGRIPGNSMPILFESDRTSTTDYWSVHFETIEDQTAPFRISIEDDSGRAELL